MVIDLAKSQMLNPRKWGMGKAGTHRLPLSKAALYTLEMQDWVKKNKTTHTNRKSGRLLKKQFDIQILSHTTHSQQTAPPPPGRKVGDLDVDSLESQSEGDLQITLQQA